MPDTRIEEVQAPEGTPAGGVALRSIYVGEVLAEVEELDDAGEVIARTYVMPPS